VAQLSLQADTPITHLLHQAHLVLLVQNRLNTLSLQAVAVAVECAQAAVVLVV
jgi:hypothetical protein